MSNKDNELNHLAIIMDGNGRWAKRGIDLVLLAIEREWIMLSGLL